jgi:hypothetical protein
MIIIPQLKTKTQILFFGQSKYTGQNFNRAGGEPPPHGQPSGVGGVKKQRVFAEKTLGGLIGRP